MNTKELCPLCGEGQVSAHVDQVECEYRGQRTLLPLHAKACDHCGSDFAGATEARMNKRALMAWRKQVDGLLTGQEIAAIRERYKLTQAHAARLFGGGPVAFSKYENDDVAQSEAMDALLRLVAGSAHVFRALVEQKGMTEELLPAGAPKVSLLRVPTLSVKGTQEQSLHYNPREFRVFASVKEQPCPR